MVKKMINIFKKDKNGEKISIEAILACIYFIGMPLSIVPLPGGISLLKAISYVAGPILIISLFFRESDLRLNIIHLFLALYVVYSIGSMFLLRDENAWVNLRGILETSIILYLISTRIYNQREKELIINSWILVGLITVIAMFINSIELGASERLTVGIGSGSEDPNQLCGYFLLPMLACMEKMLTRNKYKIAYMALVFLMIYAAFTTGSRGGLLAIFATLIVYIFIAAKGIKNKFKILLSLTLIFLIFFTLFFHLLPESVVERMSIESIREDRGSGRFELWTVVYDAITESEISLIFGYGLGSTKYFLRDSATGSTVAHNHWLQIWCDQGFIGLILFIIIIMVGGLRSYGKNKIITVSLFGMVVLSMSLTLYASYKPFWNVLMMSAINYRGES